MANNFKSKQIVITATGTTNIYTCSTVSCVVSSITAQVVTSGSNPSCSATLKFSKDGSVHKAVSIRKDIPETPIDFLTKTWVMNDTDQFVVQTSVMTNVAELIINIHYLERTASVASADLGDLNNVSGATPTNGQVLAWNNSNQEWEPLTVDSADVSGTDDTSDLPEQSTGTEPFNRYMKDFDGLDTLTNSGSDSAAETMDGAPDAVVFVAENTDLTTPKPMKVTFGDIMAAIVTRGVEDLANAGIGSVSDYTFGGIVGDFNGDGAVGSADLLDFLVLFGTSWANNNSSYFQPTVVNITSTAATSVTATTAASAQVLSFAASDIALEGGTQNVTATASTNTIRITEQGDPYFIDLIQNKQLVFTFADGGMTFDVEEAGSQINVFASISMYDADDNQLGTTALVPASPLLTFVNAGTNIALAQESTLQTNNASLASVSGAVGGLDVDDLSYIEVQLKAWTNGGAISVSIEDFEMRLRISE